MKAWLELELPPGAAIEGAPAGNRYPLEPGRHIWIGRGSGNDLRILGMMFGGQRNCGLVLQDDGTAVLFHAGHALSIEVDGELLRPHGEPRVLRHGSTFAPEGKPGLRFRLVVDDSS